MTHTPGTYVGLLDPENESATMDCSCTLRRSINRRDIVKLYHCPVHAAAPAMLEALRETAAALWNFCEAAEDDVDFDDEGEGFKAYGKARAILSTIDKGE